MTGEVTIDYVNYRGERGSRLIRPVGGSLGLGSNEWHPEPQWLFTALDIERNVERTCALAGILRWQIGSHGWRSQTSSKD